MYPRSFLCEKVKIEHRKELCEIGEEVIWESRFTSFFYKLLARRSSSFAKVNAVTFFCQKIQNPIKFETRL